MFERFLNRGQLGQNVSERLRPGSVNMQIASLRVFCDVVENRSITAAAKKNRVTHSAVSQQLRAMERSFQCPLIARQKGAFRLTRQGETVYTHGKSIVATIDTALARLQEIKHKVSGPLRVAAIYSAGIYILPPYLRLFLKAFPDVRIEVEYQASQTIYDDVAANTVDLGLVAYPCRNADIDATVVQTEMMSLAVSPDHPFAKAKSIELKALNGQDFVSFEPVTPTRKALDNELRSAGIVVRHIMEVNNVDTAKRAIETGTGVGILPRTAIGTEVEKRSIVEVNVTGKQWLRPIGVIFKKSKMLSPASQSFISVLKETAL